MGSLHRSGSNFTLCYCPRQMGPVLPDAFLWTRPCLHPSLLASLSRLAHPLLGSVITSSRIGAIVRPFGGKLSGRPQAHLYLSILCPTCSPSLSVPLSTAPFSPIPHHPPHRLSISPLLHSVSRWLPSPLQ